MDREDIADNLVKRWKDEPRNALEVASNLISKIIAVFKEAIVEDEESEDCKNRIAADIALKSTEYKGFLAACAELEKVNISGLNQK